MLLFFLWRISINLQKFTEIDKNGLKKPEEYVILLMRSSAEIFLRSTSMKYDAELKRILDTYAQNAAEREELCALALEIIRQRCPAALEETPPSDSESRACLPLKPDSKE